MVFSEHIYHKSDRNCSGNDSLQNCNSIKHPEFSEFWLYWDLQQLEAVIPKAYLSYSHVKKLYSSSIVWFKLQTYVMHGLDRQTREAIPSKFAIFTIQFLKFKFGFKLILKARKHCGPCMENVT